MTDDPEVAAIVKELPPPALHWKPDIGRETRMLRQYLEEREGFAKEELRTVQKEAFSILGRCIDPSSKLVAGGGNTGLAIGYVQSGKTTSFMTLSAMAADNQFPLIIVLAGTQVSLLQQNHGRFEDALQLNRGAATNPWMSRSNPRIDDSHDDIRRALAGWQDETFPQRFRKTVILTVMKQHDHLRHLAELLDRLQDELENTPVLVIDDEADQAGLNTKVKKGEESTTYSRIVSFRNRLPWHTYVMYTATPQANLMIGALDVLAPDFGVTLTPGSYYTGGKAFFQSPDSNKTVVEIEPGDLLDGAEEIPEEPPAGLKVALQSFFLGAAEGLHRADETGKGPSNRSMMIHPSRLTNDHGIYTNWVRTMRDIWSKTLRQNPDSDEAKLLLDEFRAQYDDLRATVPDILPFDQLVALLPHTISNTGISEMNSLTSGQGVNWTDTYAHILIGGQVLDRGFTVEGLTVTYMPRGLGVGNSDTIQQRARFFGYKKGYIGFCRVHLHPDLVSGFQRYVEHEEHLHEQIRSHLAKGDNLKDWERNMLLDTSMKITRSSVYTQLVSRGSYAGGYWWPRYPHASRRALEVNRNLFQALRESFEDDGLWQPYEDTDDNMTKHLEATGLPLRDVFENFILNYQVPSLEDSLGQRDDHTPSKQDETGFVGLRTQLAHILDNDPNATVDLYLMAGGRERKRGLYQGIRKIKTLLSGATNTYEGDRNIGDATRVRVQLHILKLEEDGTEFEIRNVPVLAVYLPDDSASPWLVARDE